MKSTHWKLLIISFFVGILAYGILFAISYVSGFHYSYKTYSPIIAIITAILFFTFKLEEFNKNEFRIIYESEISKKLNISEIEFRQIFKEQKSLLIHLPLGFGAAIFGIYLLFNKYIAGILFVMTGTGFLYMALRKKVIYIKLAKEGIYTNDFGFLYFKHIEKIDFYRHYGQTHSAYMKIYMKNHQLYKMKEPFLLQSISACENRKELVKLLMDKTEKTGKNYGI